ncbi:ABC transporter substrate-binding protein [Bradyrhizobium barranii subsp. barranii]|uniref:ABC transporter substrate-binding protein n=1 Tax=Bradyrhizobium barranii subsp. barranii TaxID=2823807 RepID=A0A939S6X8_9BRAD|nr:ABC transporter substrate-binding protein [Bradyrhizobium barranii]UEM10843.1 ABC transporter substrate-binding protein [Bradyrhizobium barranii subsp. barranii]
MRRRDFISLLVGGAAVVWPLAAGAQQIPNRKRLAIFSPAEPSAVLREHSKTKAWRALFAELRRLGQIEGQNLEVERYGREQNTSGLEALATEVVRGNPAIIYVIGADAVIFKKLTSDPVKQGLAESLAHPGGNFTGASIDAGLSIHGKRIALLREMVPTISILGCLALRAYWNGPTAGPAIRAAAEAASLALRVSLVEFGASEADYRAAIESISRDGANAVMVLPSPETFQNSTLIAKLLSDVKLPTIFSFTESVEAGGLMAYSFDLIELNKRVANNIDAILRGAKPGDIPIYQVTKFELSINIKTAKQLGLSVPPALVAIADTVIE